MQEGTGGQAVEGRKTVRQYRVIDLSLFCLILIFFENLLVKAASAWFPGEPWSVSVTAAVTAIVMIRWGPWAAIHAFLGGAVYVLASGGSGQQLAVYALGNLACLAVLPLVRRWGWEKIRENSWANFLYSFLVLLSMQAGRGIIAMLLGSRPLVALGFITTDVISYVFTMMIVWIVSKLDGMLEDQKHYLARVNDPRNQKGGVR